MQTALQEVCEGIVNCSAAFASFCGAGLYAENIPNVTDNVIKLSKSAHTKNTLLDFSRWVFFSLENRAYLAGRTMTCPSQMVLAFTRRSALRSKMALYFIKLEVVIIVLFPSNRMTVYLDTFCWEYSKSLHHQFP